MFATILYTNCISVILVNIFAKKRTQQQYIVCPF